MNFKRSLTSLNLEFFFLPGCHTKVKDQSAQLFTYSWRKNRWIHSFAKDISTMGNANSVVWTRVDMSLPCLPLFNIYIFIYIYIQNDYALSAWIVIMYLICWINVQIKPRSIYLSIYLKYDWAVSAFTVNMFLISGVSK